MKIYLGLYYRFSPMSFLKTCPAICFLYVLLLVLPGYSQSPTNSYHELAGFQYLEVISGDASNPRLPVLLALHYSSSSPEEVLRYYDSIGPAIRIILPRGNYPKRNGYSWFPKDHYSRDTASQILTTANAVDSVAKFAMELFKKYPVKPIVSGLSQGGDISLLLAIRYPQLFKAALPMLGFIHREAYQQLKKPSSQIPIHLVHGEADKIVPIGYVKKESDHLQRLSFNLSISTYPNVEHDVNQQVKADYAVFLRKWLR